MHRVTCRQSLFNYVRIVCVRSPLFQKWSRADASTFGNGVACPLRVGMSDFLSTHSALTAHDDPMWGAAIYLQSANRSHRGLVADEMHNGR